MLDRTHSTVERASLQIPPCRSVAANLAHWHPHSMLIMQDCSASQTYRVPDRHLWCVRRLESCTVIWGQDQMAWRHCGRSWLALRPKSPSPMCSQRTCRAARSSWNRQVNVASIQPAQSGNVACVHGNDRQNLLGGVSLTPQDDARWRNTAVPRKLCVEAKLLLHWAACE